GIRDFHVTGVQMCALPICAEDEKAILIEVGPGVFGIYFGNDALICTNHYQSKALRNKRANRSHIRDSHSKYRFEKLSEHLDQTRSEERRVGKERTAREKRE